MSRRCIASSLRGRHRMTHRMSGYYCRSRRQPPSPRTHPLRPRFTASSLAEQPKLHSLPKERRHRMRDFHGTR
ncbi:hypothetical protein BDW22DRAFT_1353667 [Trametopsis cervina]|nr:hypothetical protein BDW22DRAFT_1353667 [Trametopsis cervina]